MNLNDPAISTLVPLALLAGLGFLVFRFQVGRDILAAILLVGGASGAIYGITRLNSATNQLAAAFGQRDDAAVGLVAGGIAAAIVGLVLLVIRRRHKNVGPGPDLKKCPWCAEAIQREAIHCRYCGKSIEVSSSATAS